MIKFENKTNGRYYYLFFEKDLFDDVLVVVRGVVNYRPRRRVVCHGHHEIHKHAKRLCKIRITRGYTLVD
jgi:hypothetical protein